MLFFFLYEVSSFGLTGPLLVTLLLPLYPKARLAVLTLSLPADLQRFLIVLLVVQGLFNYADYDVNTNVLIFICSELCPFGVLHLHWDSVLCRAPWHETWTYCSESCDGYQERWPYPETGEEAMGQRDGHEIVCTNS